MSGTHQGAEQSEKLLKTWLLILGIGMPAFLGWYIYHDTQKREGHLPEQLKTPDGVDRLEAVAGVPRALFQDDVDGRYMVIAFPVEVRSNSDARVWGATFRYSVDTLLGEPVIGRFSLPEKALPFTQGEIYRTTISIPEYKIGKRSRIGDHSMIIRVEGVKLTR
jgi:hypothetical protein